MHSAEKILLKEKRRKRVVSLIDASHLTFNPAADPWLCYQKDILPKSKEKSPHKRAKF